ncbi:MAG TPA: PadR family transcriptional regulator [Solirubrobacteraceae bacterium]|jgi:DNA-binding PadR family transcriptional regulator
MHEAHAMHGPWRASRRGRGPGFFAMQGGRGGPWGGQFPFDAFFRGFGGHGHGRGRRARRGDVRAALLVLLDEQPRNGYQLIQEIEQRSEGFWRPSPGSVYPALQQLEDEGLVRTDEAEGRRTYALTDEGRGYVAENREALGEPWTQAGGGMDQGVLELRGHIAQVAAAAMQAAMAGHADDAKRVLGDARRSLYRILAEDDPEERGEV